MKLKSWLICAALLVLIPCMILAQAKKPLTNDDIVNMTTQGFNASLIIKAIQTSDTNFDVSPEALTNLKNAGVNQDVMEAMMTAHSNQAAGATATAPAPSAAPAPVAAADASKPQCNANGCLLREGTEVPLQFVNAISSKTANEGDPVEFVLADVSDLQIMR